MSRTIEISDETCKYIERYWRGNTGPSGDIREAVIAARPPVPRTIEVDGEVLTRDERGNWRDENGAIWAYDNGVLADAFDRIWQLENPDGEVPS